ncbi:MAG: helix-hairpin-helix domain-containing protein [Candidatus Thorarchaeota archaeon]|jgi:meiotic recombination protein SPO11
MSRKKSKKKPETVQATLGEVLGKSKPKKTTKKSAKKTKKKAPSRKKPTAKPKKTTSKKKPATKKETPRKKKTPAKKKPTKSKKPAKKTIKKKEVTPAPLPETDFSLKQLPGVGPKLEVKLMKAKYGTVEKISRARSVSIAKKVEGLSKTGAKKLVDAAKDLVKKSKAPATVSDLSKDVSDEPTPVRIALTDVPGLGSKLASSMERAGYDSVARIARATPSNVAKKVDGLSSTKAAKIVAAAKNLIRTQEMARITGDPETVKLTTSAKTAPKKKEPVKKEEAPKKTTGKRTKKKTTPKKAPARKKPSKKIKPPPKRKKPKAIRKESGLPVPKAVEDFAVEMKAKWAAAEKRAKSSKPEDAIPLLETVEVVSLSADDTTERIVDTALDILNETLTTGRPAFEIPSRSGDNIVWDEIRDLLLLGMKTISRPYHSLASVVDATRTARVMEIVFNLLKSNLHATKREVYYSDVNLFREQKYSDKIIEDVASMIQTTRDSIHVVASARGSAMGRVTIRDGGDLIDLTKMGTGGWAVTPFLDQLEVVESDAEFIILSEKDAAVMRLAEAKYWNRQPCIVLTGKGSGDIATRAFLKMLVKELEIPAFALVDSDPYGHYIYSVFLRGSKRLSYESPFIATPELKLLGVLSRDLDEYNIPKSVRIPMQPTDIKRVMLKEPFVQKNKEWVKDLRLMLQLKEKAEIQAFAAHSFEYLTDDYLPTKLDSGDWI